jgi:hypothetical protein
MYIKLYNYIVIFVLKYTSIIHFCQEMITKRHFPDAEIAFFKMLPKIDKTLLI